MGFFNDLFGDGDSSDSDDFSQKDFNGKNLAGRNFEGKDISQCEFKRANLQNAIFAKCDVTQCDFSGADLRGSRWDGADVTQCNFAGAGVDGMVTAGTSFTQCENLPPHLYSKFDDIDRDEDKWGLARWKLQGIAQVAQGQIIERRDDDKIWFSGMHNGRPFRVLVETTWGGVEFEMKANTQRGNLTVHFDREAQMSPPQQADVWDSGGDQKFFIAPGVYIEDDPQELHRQKMMFWGDMPQMFTYFMPAANAKYVRVRSGDEICIGVRDDVLAGDLTYRAKMMLDFADALARACGG